MAEDPVAATTAPITEVEKVANTAPETAAAAPETVAPLATEPISADQLQKENPPATDVNGHAGADAATGSAIEAAPALEDVNMQDAPEPAAAATPMKPETAASTKKAVNGSSKKKSSGVPEHKSKKLNRKKSKPTLRLDAKPGELYLARMKGHQPWPSIICDEDMLPQALLTHRPVTAALPDGTFKRDEYASGGKREHERTFPTMFLFTNEFAWMVNSDLSPTTPEECGEAASKAKSKTLAEAYKVAAEGHDLEHFKGLLKEHEELIEAEVVERAEREAKKAAKDKRKSDAAAAPASDDMDVDDKPKSKKRKKEAGTDEDGKPAKQAKSEGIKLKLSTPKTPKDTAPKGKTPKSKSAVKKSAAKVGSDEEEEPKAAEKTLTPAEALEKKEKEVRYIRHKLQKGFLNRDNPPNEDEIKQMSSFLEKVESYSEIEGSILRATKVHKVLKAMIKLDSIPMDETYKFTDRSQKLLGNWNKVLADDTTATDNKEAEKKADGSSGGEDKPAEDAKDKSAIEPKSDDAAATETETAKKDSKPEEPAAEKPAEAPANEEPAEEAAKPVETKEGESTAVKPEPAAATAEATA